MNTDGAEREGPAGRLCGFNAGMLLQRTQVRDHMTVRTRRRTTGRESPGAGHSPQARQQILPGHNYSRKRRSVFSDRPHSIRTQHLI
jgi:hypothetical protein